MAFKMRGEPLQRNFGIASPNKKTDTETKYLDDKTNAPKTPKMNKEVTQKKPPSAPRTMPMLEVSDNFNAIGSNDKTMYDHLTTEGLKTPKPSTGASKSKKEARKEARQADRKARNN